jgi:hypothetical protein
MSQGDNKWNDLQFIDPRTNKEADYYIVINHPYLPGKAGSEYDPIVDYYEPSKTIAFQIEPLVVRNKGWNDYYKMDEEKMGIFRAFSIENYRPYGWWEVNINYQDLKDFHSLKPYALSCVSTGKDYYPGHKNRLRMIQYLSKRDDFDLYGRARPNKDDKWGGTDIILNCPNYQGEFPMRAKEGGIANYRYHFCCENSMERNYFTEKIMDALLCEALPLYWGCPNISDFIPKDSFVWLPVDTDFNKACDILESTIRNDEWPDRLPYIREAKRIIMDELNLFPTIEKIIAGEL